MKLFPLAVILLLASLSVEDVGARFVYTTGTGVVYNVLGRGIVSPKDNQAEAAPGGDDLDDAAAGGDTEDDAAAGENDEDDAAAGEDTEAEATSAGAAVDGADAADAEEVPEEPAGRPLPRGWAGSSYGNNVQQH